MMAENPDIEARLRKEIMEFVGPNKRPTYDDIRDMKYLRAFVNGAVPFDRTIAARSHLSISNHQRSSGYILLCGLIIYFWL